MKTTHIGGGSYQSPHIKVQSLRKRTVICTSPEFKPSSGFEDYDDEVNI